jgi:hypothetical protein
VWVKFGSSRAMTGCTMEALRGPMRSDTEIGRKAAPRLHVLRPRGAGRWESN